MSLYNSDWVLQTDTGLNVNAKARAAAAELTASAGDADPAGRAPRVVQDVPARVEEVVVRAGERAGRARLNGLVPPREVAPARRRLRRRRRCSADGPAVEFAQLLAVDAAGAVCLLVAV